MSFLKKYSILISLLLPILTSCGIRQFDSDYAFSLIETQCSFKERVPGSKAHEECADFLIKELGKYADTVYTQEFKRAMSYSKDTIIFKNIIAEYDGGGEERIMLFSHYDSRPFSSEKGRPTMGANDGASSTALLLAMLKYFKEEQSNKKITIVLFDGEDGGREMHYDEWFVGSKYFASKFTGTVPDIAILIDMIGDKDLVIYKDGNSEIANPDLNEKIFRNAEKLKKKTFKSEIGYFVDDDHIALNAKGFRCVDIIDMNYAYWHTPEDTPDKCSKASLADVADVLIMTINER